MTTHQGQPHAHDSALCRPGCDCRGGYVGRHSKVGLAVRRRRERAALQHEARKAALLGQVAAMTVLRVVEGGAG